MPSGIISSAMAYLPTIRLRNMGQAGPGMLASVFASIPGPAWPMFRRRIVGRYAIAEDMIPEGIHIWAQDAVSQGIASVLRKQLMACGIEAEDRVDTAGETENGPLPQN